MQGCSDAFRDPPALLCLWTVSTPPLLPTTHAPPPPSPVSARPHVPDTEPEWSSTDSDAPRAGVVVRGGQSPPDKRRRRSRVQTARQRDTEQTDRCVRQGEAMLGNSSVIRGYAITNNVELTRSDLACCETLGNRITMQFHLCPTILPWSLNYPASSIYLTLARVRLFTASNL